MTQDRGCRLAVERMPRNQEVMGLNPTGCLPTTRRPFVAEQVGRNPGFLESERFNKICRQGKGKNSRMLILKMEPQKKLIHLLA